jgi:hypothetical protein
MNALDSASVVRALSYPAPPEALLVAEPVRAALEDADLVVQPLDEAERDFVVRTAVGRGDRKG